MNDRPDSLTEAFGALPESTELPELRSIVNRFSRTGVDWDEVEREQRPYLELAERLLILPQKEQGPGLAWLKFVSNRNPHFRELRIAVRMLQGTA